MSSFASKISTIRGLRVDPFPPSLVLDGCRSCRIGSTIVVITPKGEIYSNSVQARCYYVTTSDRLHEVLKALETMRLLSPAAVGEHIADELMRRKTREMASAARDLERAAGILGLKLTKKQAAATEQHRSL